MEKEEENLNSDQFSENKEEVVDPNKHVFSEQGKRQAASIADFIFMRHFFPKLRDRKKFHRISSDFITDMKYDMSKGKI